MLLLYKVQLNLDNINTQLLQLARNLNLLDGVELATGHLLGVAECGVENIYFVIHNRLSI